MKLIWILLAVISCVLITGCGDDAADKPDDPTQQAAERPTAEPVEEPVDWNKLAADGPDATSKDREVIAWAVKVAGSPVKTSGAAFTTGDKMSLLVACENTRGQLKARVTDSGKATLLLSYNICKPAEFTALPTFAQDETVPAGPNKRLVVDAAVAGKDANWVAFIEVPKS